MKGFGLDWPMVGLVVVIIVSVASVYILVRSDRSGQSPTAAVEFERNGDACSDLPRLVAAYEAKHESIKARGGFREEERALFDAALRDTRKLADECVKARAGDTGVTLDWYLRHGDLEE